MVGLRSPMGDEVMDTAAIEAALLPAMAQDRVIVTCSQSRDWPGRNVVL
jgi:hypothetical protein